MTERLADIGARIRGVRQLETVISAMRSIAAARAQQSRSLMQGVDAHAGVVAQAIAEALHLLPDEPPPPARHAAARRVWCCSAPSRVLPAATHPACWTRRPDGWPGAAGGAVFLVGSRGAALAGSGGSPVAWHTPMASHADGVPALAGRIAGALFDHLPRDGLERLDLLFAVWSPGRGLELCRRSLLPLDRRRLRGGPPRHRAADHAARRRCCWRGSPRNTSMPSSAAPPCTPSRPRTRSRVQTLAAARSNITAMLEPAAGARAAGPAGHDHRRGGGTRRRDREPAPRHAGGSGPRLTEIIVGPTAAGTLRRIDDPRPASPVAARCRPRSRCRRVRALAWPLSCRRLFGAPARPGRIIVSGNIEAHESVLSFTQVQAPIIELPFDEGAACRKRHGAGPRSMTGSIASRSRSTAPTCRSPRPRSAVNERSLAGRAKQRGQRPVRSRRKAA